MPAPISPIVQLRRNRVWWLLTHTCGHCQNVGRANQIAQQLIITLHHTFKRGTLSSRGYYTLYWIPATFAVMEEMKKVLTKVATQMGYSELWPKHEEVILDWYAGATCLPACPPEAASDLLQFLCWLALFSALRQSERTSIPHTANRTTQSFLRNTYIGANYCHDVALWRRVA